MIIPWLKGFLMWQKAPLTWMLVFLNVFIFILTIEARPPAITKDLGTSEKVILSGKLFYQFRNPGVVDLPTLANTDWIMLGAQALRDPEFLTAAKTTSFRGDVVAIEKWKVEVEKYRESLLQRNSRLYGLQTHDSTILSWITYQFMHAGMIHLLSNMVMLVLFAAALEQAVGGLVLVVLYILGGFAGAYGFLLLGTASVAPMVGASASLSALMGFYACFEKKKRVSFFYFVSPIKGLYGWIYLPTLVILPLCFLPDLVGYLSTPTELGEGIAYTAHIGGAVFGILLGSVAKWYRHTPLVHKLFSYAK